MWIYLISAHFIRSTTAPHIKTVYPELIKRFDDAQDDIRILTAKVFVMFFHSIARWQTRMGPLEDSAPGGSSTVKDETCEGGFREIKLDDIHWEAIVKGITIHLDDMNPSLQVGFILP
jgi:dynein assembly factor 5